ncbi:MAG: hypothetical protein WBB07_21880 [Mycobacterium sp.]
MTPLSPPERNAVNKIFGIEIPQESSDERDPDDGRGDSEREGWLRENVPPHHR